MSFIIRKNEFSPEVRKFVYQKQFEFKLKSGHQVSLGKTIERLLKEAFDIKSEKDKP